MNSARPTVSERPRGQGPAAHAAQRGFTLIELGIVIAITAVIAAVVVPDFIEMARNQLAKKAAVQVADLLEGARWSFHRTAVTADDPSAALWPGESTVGQCPGGVDPLDFLGPEGQALNPWGKEFHGRLRQGAAHGGPPADARENYALNGPGPDGNGPDIINPGARNCALMITTEVPARVATVFQTYLPGAGCGGGCPGGGASPGFVICCSQIPKPGIAASLSNAIWELGPPAAPPPPPPPPGGGK